MPIKELQSHLFEVMRSELCFRVTCTCLLAGYCFYNGASGASASTTIADGSSSACAGSVSPAEIEHASRCAFQVGLYLIQIINGFQHALLSFVVSTSSSATLAWGIFGCPGQACQQRLHSAQIGDKR